MDQLLDALLLPGPEARQAWNRWRARNDISALPYASQVLLPALTPRLSEWLVGDPAAAVLQGIVRRTWTHNQVQLRMAVELVAMLRAVGVQALVVGPLAWSVKTRAPGIRSIPHLTLLVRRKHIQRAAQAFLLANWTQHGELYSDGLDWYDHLCFERDKHHVNLHWRLIPTPPEDALDCEDAFFFRTSSLQWNGQALDSLSAEATLLHMLCDIRHHDYVPWQADVALTGLSGMDWDRFRKLALRFGPQAIERLAAMRDHDVLAIPSLVRDDPASIRDRVELFWDDYRRQSYHRKESVSWVGFVGYLAQRWDVRHPWQVPFVGVKVFLRHRKAIR